VQWMNRHGSMKRVYRMVWSHARSAGIPVAEAARVRSKPGGTRAAARVRAIAATVALAMTAAAPAAPGPAPAPALSSASAGGQHSANCKVSPLPIAAPAGGQIVNGVNGGIIK
jgi:hypothetical protein